jgi:hypothetical protein
VAPIITGIIVYFRFHIIIIIIIIIAAAAVLFYFCNERLTSVQILYTLKFVSFKQKVQIIAIFEDVDLLIMYNT